MANKDNDPYVVIAADSHAGLPTEQYRPYLEKKYWPELDNFLAEQQSILEAITKLGVTNSKFAKDWFEEHDEELVGSWDAVRRDATLDADGVAAEVVYPDADAVESRTAVPFGAGLGLSGDLDPELGLAGSKAHNRWLAELVAASPGASPLWCGTRADHRGNRSVLARDRLGERKRTGRSDDPSAVVQPDPIPRPPLRPGLGAVRGIRDASGHPLRIC